MKRATLHCMTMRLCSPDLLKLQHAHLHDVEVALVGLAKGVPATGEAVEEDEAEGEHIHALALAHLLPAAAEQLLRRLPPAAPACTPSPAIGSFSVRRSF